MPRNGEQGMAGPIGAAMVVGGGIAGMQAALDLAKIGYKVHLVEKNSAIGGHMARLDKTFPTNDCAMCTISPRLVDTGRHPNIEIIVDSEVTAIEGEAGNFTASVRTRPRFIDADKCTACAKCAEVCPVPVANAFDGALGQRRAAYMLYPQATPSSFAIDKRGVAPCRRACPIGQRAQGYIALIAEGRFEDAYRAIKEDNPFPGVCGRICNARCEDECSRALVDEPLNIRGLKRFVTDVAMARPRVKPAPAPRRHGEPVAVIGAGPCGLTAARDLCLQGYPVSVFESLPVAGGMLRVGVPEFRLPSQIVDREVQDILDLGVELHLSTPVEDLDDLFSDGFKAVLIAVGAHEGVPVPVAGNDLDGVLINTRFLRDARLAETADGADGPRSLVEGKRVVVIGGGDVAMDVARTAVRLGASEVKMAVRGSSGGMPASVTEVGAALAEGISAEVGLDFLRLIDDGAGRVAGLECQRVESFERREDGRLVAHVVANSNFVMAADVVIFSVGQKAGLAFLPESAGVAVDAEGTVAVDADTLATGRPGVFAAGDAVSGTAFVVDAIAGGHRCAETIHRYLRGEAAAIASAPAPPEASFTQAELDRRVVKGEIAPGPRTRMPQMPAGERKGVFAEVEGGYSEEEARLEAARCLACGICSECLLCVDACEIGAIDLDMKETVRHIPVGAVVLAPGYRAYPAEQSEEFGFGRYPNVVTSLQYERLLSPSGPTGGVVRRPSDDGKPKKVAFLQCVGSRDRSHDYCSAVCCMYAAKQAIMTKEHEPGTEAHVFMMDMRSFSKGYDAYYLDAREKHGVKYTRCRISSLKEDPASRDLILRHMDRGAPGAKADGSVPPGVRDEAFDMVVLSVGMEISQEVRELGRRLGVELDGHGFCKTVQFDPPRTSRRGIYAAGTFREPKDIPESLLDSSAAAASVAALLAPARGTLTRSAELPPQRDVSAEEPRIAVFVCHCGTNIGGFLDVPGVAAYAKGLAKVAHAEDNLFACSQNSVAHIADKVRQLNANRVVVAACTPLTHEPVFRDSLSAAGLNPYLLDMANIRNQCSWVHPQDRGQATNKAKDLVRMAVARVANLEPLSAGETKVKKAALVIGGGGAGMTAALSLADQGFPVHLVEREDRLGGNLAHLHFGIDEWGAGAGLPPPGEESFLDPQAFRNQIEARVAAHPLISLHLASLLTACGGFVGNFTSTIEPAGGGAATEISHGVTVVCIGGVEYRGEEYGYGTDPRIVTQQEFEALLSACRAGAADGGGAAPPRSVVMIQCVGPADRYCGRICCTSALKNALALKRLDPKSRITVIYKDIRTYGFKERLYTQAREEGVLFIRYEDDRPPEVAAPAGDGPLGVAVWEDVMGRELTLDAEMVVLSTPVVPSPAAPEIAQRLKVPLNSDGFFLEAHIKLRPVDFLAEGIFMAGLAHYPKLLEESLVQARAAAAQAAAVLSRDVIETGGSVAVVDSKLCVGCLTCVRSCAFAAPRIEADLFGVGGIAGAARIEAALCQGCGLCAADCPAGAIQLRHYTGAQVRAKVDALCEKAGVS